MDIFVNVEEFAVIASNTQGVCIDEDYFYITEASEIMKYTRAGGFVTRHDTVGDGSNNHLGDLCIKDGKLYVKSSFYPSTPYNEIVMVYDAATLTYETEYTTFGAGNNHIGEGIDYRNGHFWTVSDNYDIIYKWEDGFTSPTSYAVTAPAFTGSIHHLQTLVWTDDETLFMQLHGGPSPSYPETTLQYSFIDDVLTFVKEIVRPDRVEAGQGIAWDSINSIMYFACRSDTAAPDRVIGAKFVSKDWAFNSSTPVDKIVATYTGNFSLPDDSTASTTITTSLNKKCFPELLWSVDNINFYPGSMSISVGAGMQRVICACSVSLNSAMIVARSNFFTAGDPDYTIYYRLVLIWPI